MDLRLFIYFFLDGEPLRDRSPIHRGTRGGGRGGGRGRAGRGERPQDPPIPWSRHYIPQAAMPFGEQSPGPTQRYPNDCGEGAFFNAMFTDDLWNLIVTETNRYHDHQALADPHKHKRKWSPVTREEMEAFVGIIHMGVVKLPRIKMYWSNNTLLHHKSVSEVMSQTRFIQITAVQYQEGALGLTKSIE